MTVGKKVILTIYIILIILFCSFLLCCMFGILSPQYIVNIANTILLGGFSQKLLYALVFILMIGLGLFLLCFDFGKHEINNIKIAELQNGTISITIKAVEELISKYLSKEKTIKENHSTVIFFDSTISINVAVAAFSNTNIPDITKTLGAGLKDSIESQTGIKVKDVQILVQNILDPLSTDNNIVNRLGQ